MKPTGTAISPLKKLLLLLGGLVVILYPFALYLGLQVVPPRVVSIILLIAALARMWFMDKSQSGKLNHTKPILWIVTVTLVLGLVFNDPFYLLINPSISFLALAAFFSSTFFFPPNFAERMALEDFPEGIPPAAKYYCAGVTSAWSIFFVISFCISLWTAFFAELYVWTLFNGLFIWVFMGAFFLIEYAIRRCLEPTFQASLRRMLAKEKTTFAGEAS